MLSQARFENGPYNLLSLDGGGIRGVSELVILDRIMRRVQEKEGLDKLPKPCDYFHLIGGTSTGGLISIMLGRLRMSTAEALEEYNSFAQKIFRKKNRRMSITSQFREDTLKTVVSEVARKYSPEESVLMRDPNKTTPSGTGRAFVCAKPSMNQDRGPLRIRAYPSDDDWDRDCKIWEAARATTAAPGFFRSMPITSATGVTEEFIDPAFGCNNPIGEVLREAGEILDASCKLGCVLSLGTGTRPKNMDKDGGTGKLFQMAKLLKDYTTDSENMHREMAKRFTDFPSTYFRFSVPQAAAVVAMAKYKKIPELKQMTEEYLNSAEVAAQIEKVSDILCEGKTEGVTIGHVLYPNKTQIVMDKRRANTGGIASHLFTGRKEYLDKLSAYFSKREGNKGPQRKFLLYGMGGMGKTQIALKFKQMVEADKVFDRVIWVDATDSTTIEESYSEFASSLPPGDAGIGNTDKERVLNWMDNTEEEWLLIMDNRNDNDQPIAAFLPKQDKGSILYTARPDHLKQMLKGDAALEVNKMGEQEAITLLLKAVRDSTEPHEDRELSLPIVQELGCLPLAIDQAGAYIYMYKCSLGDYLAMFLKERQSILSDPQHKGSNEHNLAVYATFDLSHKALVGYSKGKQGLGRDADAAAMAIKILSFICFYHDQGVMEETVKRAAEHRAEYPDKVSPLGVGRLSLKDIVRIRQGSTWNPEDFRRAVRVLESLSIIKTDRARTISMHVLVHSWARDRMSVEERESFSMSARIILYNSVPFTDEPDSFIYRRKIAPHIRACESLVEPRDIVERENAYLARQAAVVKDAGRIEDAIRLWEEVVRERRLLDEPDGDSVLLYSFQLAGAYLDAGDLFKAEAWLTDILERGKEEMEGNNDRKELLSEVQSRTAKLYHDIGFAREAAEHQAEMIRLVKEVGNPEVMADLPEMEDLYEELQALANDLDSGAANPETEKSEAELWEEYEDAVNVYGIDGERALRRLAHLAHLMRRNYRGTCTWILAETVVTRCRQRYGPNHALIRRALREQAQGYYYDGFALKAKETQRENVELHQAQCGADSFHTKYQIKILGLLEGWVKLTVERTQEATRANPKNRTLMAGIPDAVLGVYRQSVFESKCHMLPCGQSRHFDLISRLGVEEKYPHGVLITPDDVGFPEMGIKPEDLYAKDPK